MKVFCLFLPFYCTVTAMKVEVPQQKEKSMQKDVKEWLEKCPEFKNKNPQRKCIGSVIYLMKNFGKAKDNDKKKEMLRNITNILIGETGVRIANHKNDTESQRLIHVLTEFFCEKPNSGDLEYVMSLLYNPEQSSNIQKIKDIVEKAQQYMRDKRNNKNPVICYEYKKNLQRFVWIEDDCVEVEKKTSSGAENNCLLYSTVGVSQELQDAIIVGAADEGVKTNLRQVFADLKNSQTDGNDNGNEVLMSFEDWKEDIKSTISGCKDHVDDVWKALYNLNQNGKLQEYIDKNNDTNKKITDLAVINSDFLSRQKTYWDNVTNKKDKNGYSDSEINAINAFKEIQPDKTKFMPSLNIVRNEVIRYCKTKIADIKKADGLSNLTEEDFDKFQKKPAEKTGGQITDDFVKGMAIAYQIPIYILSSAKYPNTSNLNLTCLATDDFKSFKNKKPIYVLSEAWGSTMQSNVRSGGHYSKLIPIETDNGA